MSHTLNQIYLERAYQIALEYGFSEAEAQKFAEEMLLEGVENVESYVAEAAFIADDAERSKWQDYERNVI